MNAFSHRLRLALKWTERYAKTDMLYLAKSGFWMNAGFVVTSVASLLLSIIFARYISKEAYGTYQYLISWIGIVGTFSLTGMNASLTGAVARGHDGTVKKSIGIQLAWGIVPFIIGLGVALYYFIQGNVFFGLALVGAAICAPFTNAANTYVAIVYGKKDFRLNFMATLVVTAIYYTVMIGTVIMTKSTAVAIAAFLIANLVANLVAYRLTIRKHRLNDSVDEKSLSYGKELSLMNVLGALASKADSVIGFQYLGPADLATYTFAKIFPEKLSGFLKSFGTIALPRFATKNAEQMKESVAAKTWKLALITLALCAAYAIVAPPFFRLVLPQYVEAVPYSQVASLILLSSLTYLPTAALISHRSRSGLYALNVVGPIIQVAVTFALIYFFGLWGAIWSRIAAIAINALISLHLSSKISDTPRPQPQASHQTE